MGDDLKTVVQAASKGDIAELEELLAQGVKLDPDVQVDLEQLPMTAAINNNRIEVIQWLLDHGVDINIGAKCKKPSSYLIHAISRKLFNPITFDPIIRMFLAMPLLDINVRDEQGRTALSHLSETRDLEYLEDQDGLEILELILNKPGVNVNEKATNAYICIDKDVAKICYFDNPTALMYAASKGQVYNCEILLNHGANVNEVAEHGHTALMIAAAAGESDVVNLLLSVGADINITYTDEYSWPAGLGPIKYKKPVTHTFSALAYAAIYGYDGIVKVLLEFQTPTLDILNHALSILKHDKLLNPKSTKSNEAGRLLKEYRAQHYTYSFLTGYKLKTEQRVQTALPSIADSSKSKPRA